MIHQRIRHARLYHGWSQAKLADMIGVTQPAVSQAEKTGNISPENLAAIAEVTGFSPEWFERGNLPDLPMGSLRFRKRASATRTDDERIRAIVRQMLETVDRLSPGLDLPPIRVLPCSATEEITEDWIEILAVQAREWLGIGPDDPIPSVVRAVERAGVIVMGCALPIKAHDAVSFWSPEGGRPVICFSRGYSGDRQRLSIGHELGHLVLHYLRSPEPRLAEREAFRFGAALLLPITAARDELEPPITLRSLAYVKAKWGISIASLIKRCVDLQIITPEKRESLEKQLSARGWRKEEPVHVPDERPILVSQIVEASLGSVSSQRLHMALGLPVLACKDLVA